VALAADADAEVSPPADGDGDCEQATNPAPASSAQPARTDLRIVDDMLRPSCRGVDGTPYTGISPHEPLRKVTDCAALQASLHRHSGASPASSAMNPTAFAGLQTRTPQAARRASARDGAGQSAVDLRSLRADSGSHPLRGLVRNDEVILERDISQPRKSSGAFIKLLARRHT